MKISLGFSPCPNDTFIFDGMLHGKVDTEGLEFEPVIRDVEELNTLARAGALDVTKLSYHAYAHLIGQYVLLDAGSALGNNCGPLLIARAPMGEEEILRGPVAIPGAWTTANFLLGLAYPKLTNKVAMLFSRIEDAVLSGEVAAGLIIHENRFTYQEKGLVKIMDLGEYWETRTGMPIPLGGIVVRRDMDPLLQHKVNRVMARSVGFALDNPEAPMPYVRQYAQAMDEAVMKAHIELYVNRFTRDLGVEGKAAVGRLFAEAGERMGLGMEISNNWVFLGG